MRIRFAPAVVLVLVAAACGPSIPTRYVLEQPVGELDYRRYQRVLDVEFVIPGNPGDAHTAVYVQRQGAGMTVFTAFVSVYERATSLAAEVKERLELLDSYEVRVERISGHYLWSIESDEDRWLLWISSNHIVKLGAPQGGEIPDGFVKAYLRIYRSDLDAHGRARSGRPSAGPSQGATEEVESEPQMPSNLR